jgi:hypothetical protein
MDLSPSDPHIKSHVSWERDLLRCDTYLWLDSAASQTCLSQISLNPNGLVGKCIWGLKLVVHNAHGYRDPQCFLLATVSPTMPSISQKIILGLRFYVLPHLKCVEFLFWDYQQLKSWMCLFNLLTSVSWLVTNLLPCESPPRRGSCILVDSFRIQFFWQRSLVTSELRVTSLCVTSFYRSVGNLTPTLI